MDESLYLRIRELNPHIVCILCAGYFIDATTITECLHTFCKSCIVKYLQTSKHCPICNTKVHETQPLLNLKADRTLQDIVFKLVPSLWENEMKRRQEFEKSRNLAESNKEELEGSQSNIEEETGMANRHLYIHDELIHIRIEPVRNGPSTQALMMQGRLRYVRCSVRAQIYHLKKLIQKLWPMAAGKEVGIMCNGKIIPETHCLKRMWLSNVKDQSSPLALHFFLKKVP